MTHPLRFLVLTALVCVSSARAENEERVIGYLNLPAQEKIVIEKSGKDRPVVVGGEQGEVWPELEISTRKLRKFSVYSEPSELSEKLIDLDIGHAPMELMPAAVPGKISAHSPKEQREYEEGRRKIRVYEKRADWLRVKFLYQPPWNGRSAWIRLGENTGGFVDAK